MNNKGWRLQKLCVVWPTVQNQRDSEDQQIFTWEAEHWTTHGSFFNWCFSQCEQCWSSLFHHLIVLFFRPCADFPSLSLFVFCINYMSPKGRDVSQDVIWTRCQIDKQIKQRHWTSDITIVTNVSDWSAMSPLQTGSVKIYYEQKYVVHHYITSVTLNVKWSSVSKIIRAFVFLVFTFLVQ